MIYSSSGRTLPNIFEEYDPPSIQTARGQRSNPGGSASTRAPGDVLESIFSGLQDHTLSVTYEANILCDLSDLVNTSWIDQTKYRVIGNEWDMKFVLDDHQASTTTIRGEIVDLSAVFESFLFQAVNYTASRPAQFLRPEAYPPMTTTRSSWGPSVQGRGLKGADVCASLRRDGDTTLIQEIDRIVMERKGPASIPMDAILSGIRTAHAEGHGFKIRRDMTDGTYVTHENVDKSCTDALLQTFEYMDSRRTKVGVLTNYNVFLVILRTGKDKIVLSSPVIRDRISRASLEPGLANDVSVWKLLLALLLYVGRPENLQGKTGIWADLWVRDPGERKENSTKKRKRNSGRDGGDQRKTTKAGEEDRSGSPAEPDDKDGAEELDHKVHCGSTSSSNSRAGSNAEIKPTDASSMDLTFTDYPSMDDEPSSLPRLSPSPSSYLDARSPLYRANLHFHQTSRQISPQDLLWFEERRFQLTKPSPSLSNIEADPWLSLDEMIAEGPHFTTFSASALGRLNPHTDNLSDSCHTEPDTFAAGSSPKTLVDLVLSPPQCQYILKLARLFSPPHHTELGIVSGSDIVSALELEVRCLTDHLADLQGSIVPRFHGLWLSQSPGGQWAILLLEKVGLGGKQIRRWEDLTWSESDLIRKAYAAIHSRGVVHGDLETRHIFFEPPSSLIPGSTPTSSTAMSTGGNCSTRNSHTLSLTSALPNSHVTIGMRVRIIDFDRAEIVNVGEAKVGVEREEEVLERLLRRGAGPAT